MKRITVFFISAILLVIMVLLMPTSLTASASPPVDLYFSEYIEGSSNNKALEIYNGTGSAIDLAAGGYNIQMFFNGNPSATLTINLTGSVSPGDVYVVAQSSASAAILAQADQTNGSGWYNGDDAVVLRKGTIFLDVIGQIGFDPGSEWGTGLVSTADNTLRRLDTICAGDPVGSDIFTPSMEWNGFATDTFDGLGTYAASCASTTLEPKINEFSASTVGTDVEYVEV
jgi:predicted extracellular nuclease